jgi:hypothetical protein
MEELPEKDLEEELKKFGYYRPKDPNKANLGNGWSHDERNERKAYNRRTKYGVCEDCGTIQEYQTNSDRKCKNHKCKSNRVVNKIRLLPFQLKNDGDDIGEDCDVNLSDFGSIGPSLTPSIYKSSNEKEFLINLYKNEFNLRVIPYLSKQQLIIWILHNLGYNSEKIGKVINRKGGTIRKILAQISTKVRNILEGNIATYEPGKFYHTDYTPNRSQRATFLVCLSYYPKEPEKRKMLIKELSQDSPKPWAYYTLINGWEKYPPSPSNMRIIKKLCWMEKINIDKNRNYTRIPGKLE